MTDRYVWAVAPRRERGRARERLDWSLARSAPPQGSEVPEPAALPLPDDEFGAPRPHPPDDGPVVLRAAPTAAAGLWQPVGPTTTLRGIVDSDVRVTGRVKDVTVSADGQRAYAASALGGLWYSADAGATWEPVGPWRTSNPATVAASSNTLTAGAVHVLFGADEAADEVWLGTGDAFPIGTTDSGHVGHYGGVGVLHRVGPVARTRAAPLVDPWDPPQAQARPAVGATPAYPGLSGQGVFRIVRNPAAVSPRDLLAGSSRGLLRHDPAAAAGTDPWSPVTVPAWEAVAAGASARVSVTDVAWTPATGAHGARIWAAVVDRPGSALTGLWLSTDDGATFARIALPAAPASVPRLVIGWHRNHPDVLYVLAGGPTLWRIDGTLAPPGAGPASVANLPSGLHGDGGNDGSLFRAAAALDPADPTRVMVGGSAVTSPIDAASVPSASFAAALYLLTVTPVPGVPGTFRTNYAVPPDANPRDATWNGSEVHADVHRIHWETVAGAAHVWVAGDGGVYRSVRGGALGTFFAASSGMAVAETGFIANHPTSPGPVLTGLQDNGTQLRIGEAVWRSVVRNGDSGGVAFDPGDAGRFVAQTTRSTWDDDAGVTLTPQFRANFAAGSPFVLERDASLFYSYAAVTRRVGPPPVTRLAVGTDRVWCSERWGESRWDGVAGVWRRAWVTLPTSTDPRAADAAPPAAPNALTQDRLPAGPPPWGAVQPEAGIRVLRWRSPTALLAVTEGAVHLLTDPGGALGSAPWARAQVVARAAVPVAGPPAVVPVPVASPNLPGFGVYNDLADDPSVAGAFYLATSHPLEPLWWWDGGAPGTCLPTTLGTSPTGTRSPAYSVVVDPASPTTVYVGTTIGVWQGTMTPPAGGNPRRWVWARFTTGLPEAAVQDLSIGVYPPPGGVGAPLRLLRAALQARGVWEVDLDAPAAQQTYLRVHPYDTRRQLPTPTGDPMHTPTSRRRTWHLDWAYERNRDHRTGAGAPAAHPDGTPVTGLLWHSSPDIWCRPAPISGANPGPVPPPPGLPWVAAPPDRFWLWSLQTALRALPPGQFPDAPLIVPDGRWTDWWVRRLRAVRAAFLPALPNPGPAGTAQVDAALWNQPQVQAAFWTAPWTTPEPTEADLVERVLHLATARAVSMNAAAVRAASAAVLRRRYVIEVCVHQRGLAKAAQRDVAVLLLRAALPTTVPAWNTMAAPPIAGLATALDLLPPDTSAGPAPNGLPGGVAAPAGWAFVDAARPARRPRLDVSAGEARTVSFDADFSAVAPNTDVLLLALVHHRAEPLALAGGALRAAVLGSSHAAARSIRVQA